MQTKTVYLILCVLLGVGSACTRATGLTVDPTLDAFFDITRHIMTSEEIDIYKQLPDLESRKQFAVEFWEKRDPDPSTDVNEAFDEFQRRVAFANRWFNERKGKDRGWDTLRGRILLQLGFPDERNTGNTPLTGSSAERRYSFYETWYYNEHQLYLAFADKNGFGEFEFYGRIPANLGDAINQSKARMMGSATVKNKNRFRFQASCGPEGVVIKIPTKLASFDEDNDQLSARFTFIFYLYRNNVASETIERKLDFTNRSAELVMLKELVFSIPLPLSEKGSYFIDIIGKDELSGERSRSFCKTRI